MVDREDLEVRTLGPCRIDSPLASRLMGRETTEHSLVEEDRVFFDDSVTMATARGVPIDAAAHPRAGWSAQADLLRPGEDPGRHRHLRRAVPGPQRRHPRPGAGAVPALRRQAGRRVPQRLPRVHRRVRRGGRRPHARGRAQHRRRGRHDARHLQGRAGPGGGGRRPRADEPQHPVRDRRGRQHPRGHGHRPGRRRAGSQGRGGRGPEDHRQRHPLHRPELRVPDRDGGGDQVHPGGERRGPVRARRRRVS